ncbi:unnamed protein product, partial [Closterium sp. Naga37s-1]
CAAALLATALGDDNASCKNPTLDLLFLPPCRHLCSNAPGSERGSQEQLQGSQASVGDLRGVGYLRLTIY